MHRVVTPLQRSLAFGLGLALAPLAVAETSTSPQSNTDETRAVVAEMLSDAETRSSMLTGNAGHDAGGFYISDGDGFKLVIGGDMKFRYDLVFGDNLDNTPDRGFESGFQNNVRLRFSGHIFDPNLYYKIQGKFAFGQNSGGAFNLLDAYAGYKFDNGWAVQWGQMKVPLQREWLVDDIYLLAPSRSLSFFALNPGRTQGVAAIYSNDEFKGTIAFTDGAGAQNSDFNTLHNVNNVYQGIGDGGTSDYAITGRGEFKLSGEWDQFTDFTSMPGSDQAVLLGAAAHIEGTGEDRITPGPPATDSNLLFAWTVDASIEGDGWNLFGSFTGFHTDNLASYSDYGWLVQGGWFLPDSDWELYARWDQIIPDNDGGARGLSTGVSFNTLTLGTNYYMHGHASKFTFAFVWFLNKDPALFNGGSVTAVPWLSNGNEANEFAFTFQWQVVF